MRLWITTLLWATSLLASDVKYDGARVHYESYGKGEEAVVFIHGWTCDLTFWRGQAPVYEKRRALLIDLPGHGQSEAPKVSYTQERFARAVEAVMRDAGVTRGVLVGHSMGGPVAFTFLRLYPKMVTGLVLADVFLPAAPKDAAEAARQKAQMEPYLQSFEAANYRETAAKVIESMFSDRTTPPMRAEIKSKMLGTPQHVVVSAMRGMFDLEAPKPGETYAVPVLTIMNAKNPRPGYEARLRVLFPNLRTYEAWDGVGHFLMMEEPERFNRAMEDFLAKR